MPVFILLKYPNILSVHLRGLNIFCVALYVEWIGFVAAEAILEGDTLEIVCFVEEMPEDTLDVTFCDLSEILFFYLFFSEKQ